MSLQWCHRYPSLPIHPSTRVSAALLNRLGSSGRPSALLQGHDGCVNRLHWSADGQLLASVSDDLSVRVWLPSTRKCISTLSTEHHGTF